MKKLLLGIVFAVVAITGVSGCTKYITVPEFYVDTVEVATKPHTDTVVVTRADTIHSTRVDTVIVTRIDSVQSPPVVRRDTTIIQVPYVVVVTRVDTLFLPSAVVHDSTWVYVQTNPTNPLAGGDPNADVAYVAVSDSLAMVFWHGHFTGVVRALADGKWRANWYTQGSIEMLWRGDFPTKQDAVLALVPWIVNATVPKPYERVLKLPVL